MDCCFINMTYYLEKIIGQKTKQTKPTRYLQITNPKRTKRKIKLVGQTRQYQGKEKELLK